MAAALFDAANRYLGAGIGEHMGYLFTGAWTIAVSALVWKQWKPLAISGALIALGVLAGMGEPFGLPGAATINAVSFSLWALWSLILGVIVLRSERRTTAAVAQPA